MLSAVSPSGFSATDCAVPGPLSGSNFNCGGGEDFSVDLDFDQVRSGVDGFPDSGVVKLHTSEKELLPLAFTEQGVAMLSTVLNSKKGNTCKYSNNAYFY